MLQHSSPGFLVGSVPGGSSSSALSQVWRENKVPVYFPQFTSLSQEDQAFPLVWPLFALFLLLPGCHMRSLRTSLWWLLLSDGSCWQRTTLTEKTGPVWSSLTAFWVSPTHTSSTFLQSRTDWRLCTTATSSHRAASSLLSSLTGITIAVSASTCFNARVNLGHN